MRMAQMIALMTVQLSAFVWASALAAALVSGCGDGGGGTPTLPGECPAPVAPVDPCDSQACFSACGVSFIVDGGLPPVALTPELDELRPTMSLRVGHSLVGVTPLEVQLRHNETVALEGRLALPGNPTRIADVAGAAWIGTDAGAVFALDFSDPTKPSISHVWRPESPVRVVTTHSKYLWLWTEGGVASMDVSDPSAPVEVGCYLPPGVEGGSLLWDVEASDQFVVAAGGEQGPAAWAWDLAKPEQVPTPLPIDPESTLAMYDGSVVLSRGGKTLQVRLSPGQAPQQIAASDQAIDVWDPVVAGGLLVLASTALDLDDGLKTFNGLEGSESGCTLPLNAADLSTSVVVSPRVVPDRRWSVDDFPIFQCGATDRRWPGLTEGQVTDEDGGLLLWGSEASILYDPAADSGVALESGGGGPAERVAVAAGGAFLIDNDPADFGMPLGASVRWAPFGDAPGAPGEPMIWDVSVVAAASAWERAWVLREAAPRNLGDPEPDPATHHLVMLEGGISQDEIVVNLPSHAAPEGLVGQGGEDLWLVGLTTVHRLDAEGAAVAKGEASLGLDPGSAVAGPLGLVARDLCGGWGLWDPDGGYHGLADPHLNGRLRRVAAVDGEHLYGITSGAPASDWSGPLWLVTYTVALDGAALILTETTRVPSSREGAGAMPVVPLLVLDHGLSRWVE